MKQCSECGIIHHLDGCPDCVNDKNTDTGVIFKFKEELKRHFKLDSGIDLSDYEHSGVFPYFNKKKQKWTSISRGKAWQIYAEWLENKLYPN